MMPIDIRYIGALHHAKKYNDLSLIIEMLRNGSSEIVEDEELRNFIADRLENKPMLGKGKKAASLEKEKIEDWVVNYVAYYSLKGLPLYNGDNSESRDNESVFSKIKELALQLGYKNLKSNDSIKKGIKNYFLRYPYISFTIIEFCIVEEGYKTGDFSDLLSQQKKQEIKIKLTELFAPYRPALKK